MKRKILSFGYMGAVSLFCCLICGCSKPEPPTGVLLHQAAAKAAEGDWTGADQLAKQVLRKEKDNASALMIRALAQNSLDSRNEAVGYAIHAARVQPDQFLPHYIQGMLLSRNGKPELALRALKEARRFRPDDINTLILLAENSIAVKRYREAAGYFKLLARDQSYRTSPYLWNGLGLCYTASSPHMALKFFQMAERYAPDDPVTILNLAVLYDDRLKDEEKARSGYERFIQAVTGKAEYDGIRSQAEFRLNSMKGR